jgi:hypothetical protein
MILVINLRALKLQTNVLLCKNRQYWHFIKYHFGILDWINGFIGAAQTPQANRTNRCICCYNAVISKLTESINKQNKKILWLYWLVRKHPYLKRKRL